MLRFAFWVMHLPTWVPSWVPMLPQHCVQRGCVPAGGLQGPGAPPQEGQRGFHPVNRRRAAERAEQCLRRHVLASLTHLFLSVKCGWQSSNKTRSERARLGHSEVRGRQHALCRGRASMQEKPVLQL